MWPLLLVKCHVLPRISPVQNHHNMHSITVASAGCHPVEGAALQSVHFFSKCFMCLVIFLISNAIVKSCQNDISCVWLLSPDSCWNCCQHIVLSGSMLLYVWTCTFCINLISSMFYPGISYVQNPSWHSIAEASATDYWTMPMEGLQTCSQYLFSFFQYIVISKLVYPNFPEKEEARNCSTLHSF